MDEDFSGKFEGLSSAEINRRIGDEQRRLLKVWFGRGIAGTQTANDPPDGLTRETLEAYHEIGRRAMEQGKDVMGVQFERITQIERALKQQ